MIHRATRSAALASTAALALLAAGCNSGKQQETSNTTTVTQEVTQTNVAADENSDMANAGETATAPEAADATGDVTTPPLPAPSTTAPQADIAPLVDAEEADTAIAAGTGITRVRHGDGWAWLRAGQILRTASADGKDVAYFRGGSDQPYLVQQDRQAYALSNGKPVHSYDDNGAPHPVDAGHRATAQQLATRARQDHQQAQTAARQHPPQPVEPNTPPAPPPQGNGQPHGAANDHRGGNNGNDNNGHDRNAAPAPTPTPTTVTHVHTEHHETHTQTRTD